MRGRLRPSYGFTLIELLVAIAAMAIMAGLGWRGLDAMLRTRTQVQTYSEQLQALQTGLAQWNADLDALLPLPNTPALDWDGRALRLTRRNVNDSGILVVAWTRRAADAGLWLRWQSEPLRSRGDLQDAWLRAAQWAQNPSAADRQREVAVLPLAQWQLFYYRADAWTNPLSSANAETSAPTSKASAVGTPDPTLPDGVRLVLTLPERFAVNGSLTRDWARLTTAGAKP